MTAQFGVHLPLIDFGGGPWTAARLSSYVREASALGFRYVCVNDHLVFRRDWLDGPTALGAVLAAAGDMTIATTVALPVVRGPRATATLLAALHGLSDGRLLAGVGPGSSAADFTAAGVPFSERWQRFDEAVQVLRVLLGHRTAPFEGRFYSAETPVGTASGTDPPPLWLPSWGSAAGIRRVAAMADGWIASAYNTDPEAFARNIDRLAAAGRPATELPNAVATTWLHVTDRKSAVDHMYDDVLGPTLNRPAHDLRACGLPIGSPEECAERIDAYVRAGAQRIFLWPLGDELAQLGAFRHRVAPLLAAEDHARLPGSWGPVQDPNGLAP